MKNCFFQKILGLFILSLFVASCGDNDITGGNTNTGGECDSSISSIITNGTIPADLSGYDQTSREIFSIYPADAEVVARYVRPGGTNNGTNYATAAGNVKSVLDGIMDASPSKVYAVLIAPGTYDAREAMAMKDNVAIVGGVTECLGVASNPGNTILSGNKTHGVFSNSSITNTALLYGVTIANGSARLGAGMNNNNSSPTLIGVTFSLNTASRLGGGMYNQFSSRPVLTGVTFSGNTAVEGGGMYNQNSSPILTEVAFSENTATEKGGGMYNADSLPILNKGIFLRNMVLSNGGGMYNSYSSPVLTGVTFSGNTSATNGGGMGNYRSSPILTGVTLSGNKAGERGGGMYNDNDGEAGPLLVNTIIWGNTAASGNQIYFVNDFSSQENLRLYRSVVQDGLPEGYISGTSTNSLNGGGFASGGGTAAVMVTFSSITTVNPGLLPLADNGGGILTHAIPTTSPAVNQGLYVRRSGTTFYYSSDNSTWYSNPGLTTTVTPPANAINLTATDATGHNRSGRPDLGAYEAR